VIAGTAEKLIERLADENYQGWIKRSHALFLYLLSFFLKSNHLLDPRFVDCILLTHRFFLKPMELCEKLILRFLIQLPENPTADEVEFFQEWQKPIQKK